MENELFENQVFRLALLAALPQNMAVRLASPGNGTRILVAMPLAAEPQTAL